MGSFKAFNSILCEETCTVGDNDFEGAWKKTKTK